jgi:hypothetical protein
VPKMTGMCDDNDPCPPNQVCQFGANTCIPTCNSDGSCQDPNLICSDCVTGSCCGCDDCVSACL